MKPQLSGPKKRPSVSKAAGAEAALSLQEELVAAIHGAFEVAVEIAIGEVTKLVGQATGGIYEEMRRENECLKQRLQTAEALLDSARMEERGGSSPPPPPPPPPPTKQQSPNPKVAKVQSCRVRGDTPPVGPSDHKHESRHEEQRSGDGVKTQRVSDAASHPEGNDGCAGALTKEVCEETSRVCVVRLESIQQMCRDSPPPLPTGDETFTLEQVTVKQEKPDEEDEEEEEEEEKDGSGCCLDSIKVEDFSPECMSAVHSQMLDEWKPEELHIQSQDSNTTLSCTGLAQACSPTLTTTLPPSTDPQPSLSSDFPNIFPLAEPGPVPEAPAQVYGVHVLTGRNLVHTLTNLYACKFCGQTFHLPSLLRRHHGQCQQKLQQCYQQPVAGSRRSRLQIYPPGCSPFRCTECNREFNRMENLKTHLRIHTGERPYTCSVCSKCFRHSGALTRHFRIHTGEKPYICGQCGKSFRNCGGLKFHQRSHIKQLQ